MNILANLGKLPSGETMLVIEKAYKPDYAIVSGYDEAADDGDKWASAIYFDGDIMAFMNEFQKRKNGLGYEDLKSMLDEEFSDVADIYEHFDVMGWNPTDAALWGYEDA